MGVEATVDCRHETHGMALPKEELYLRLHKELREGFSALLRQCFADAAPGRKRLFQAWF